MAVSAWASRYCRTPLTVQAAPTSGRPPATPLSMTKWRRDGRRYVRPEECPKVGHSQPFSGAFGHHEACRHRSGSLLWMRTIRDSREQGRSMHRGGGATRSALPTAAGSPEKTGGRPSGSQRSSSLTLPPSFSEVSMHSRKPPAVLAGLMLVASVIIVLPASVAAARAGATSQIPFDIPRPLARHLRR